jgi:hypothetical protein
MSKRAALIVGGKVTNVILLPDENENYQPPKGTTVSILDEETKCGIGWLVDGDVYKLAEATSPTDVDGFLDALDETLPRETSRLLLANYPDIASALNRGRYERAWEGFADAVAAGDVTVEQQQQIVALAGLYGIPIVEL